MIQLYQFRPKFGAPNLSPFCIKVEAWLKMAGLDYEVCYQDDPRKAPKGKLPCIELEGVIVPDSSLIIEHLENTFSIDLDEPLDAEQKAISHAFQRMIEERLYWGVVYNRWLGDSWPTLKKAVFSVLPPFVREVVPVIVQKQLRRDLHGQGIGRHSAEQINAFACQDIDAVATYLGDKPFFMGENQSTVDAVVFGILCCILKVDLDSPIKQRALSHGNLVAYQNRLGKTLFPDYYV